MRKIAVTIFLGSTIILSACNQKEDQTQAKMDEAQEMLKQATEMLQEAQDMQAAAIQKAETSEKMIYKDWVNQCVHIRNKGEEKCASLSTGAKQSACLLAASRDMTLCMADTGAESLQSTMVDQGAELGVILGETVKELDAWLQNNESSLSDFAGALAPFMEQLMETENEDVGKNMENLMKNFGDALSDALNEDKSADMPENKPVKKMPEAPQNKPIT